MVYILSPKKIKKWNKTKNIRTGACMEWGISQSQETGGGASVGAAPSHLKSPDMHLQSSGNKVGWALGIASQAPRKASANSYRRAGDRNERNFLPLWWRLVPSPPTSTCSRRTKAFPAWEFPVGPGNPAPLFSLEESERKKGRALAPSSGHWAALLFSLWLRWVSPAGWRGPQSAHVWEAGKPGSRKQSSLYLNNEIYHFNHFTWKVQWCAVLSRSVVSLCDPMNCSPPGSSVHGFLPRQEYWSGLPCLPPEDFSNPGIKPGSPAL